MTPHDGPTPAVDSGYLFPASRAQYQLFYLQGLLGDAPSYHVPIRFRLDGAVDETALCRAVAEVVDRHEALRTRFVLEDGGLHQLVDLEYEQSWRTDTVRSEEDLDRLMEAELVRPFDLERGPLFRAGLVRRDGGAPLIWMVMHHIVTDGWSAGVLVEEILTCYQAFSRGDGRPDLPEVEFQYADYSAWQDEWLRGPEAARQLAFWTGELGGDLPVLALPADRVPVAGAPGSAGENVEFPLPADAVARLRAMAEEANSTLFVAVTAVLTVLLAARTGVEDIVVGTPIANRTRREFDRTVGFFVNTVAIRSQVDGEVAFRDLLHLVRSATLRAYAHGELPFERVVEAVKPRRTSGVDPIFQVLVMLSESASGSRQVDGLRVTPLPWPSPASKFQLTLEIDDAGEQVRGFFEYRTDLFSAAWVAEFAADFGRLLQTLTDEPGRPLRDVVPGAVRNSLLGTGRPGTPSPADVDPDGARHADDPDDGDYGDFDPVYAPPRTAVERLLADVWAEVLQQPAVGIDDNYFAVGGDSIRSVQLLARCRERGLEITLRDLLARQTIRELAPAATEATAAAPVPDWQPFDLLVPEDRIALPDQLDDAYPMTMTQVGMVYESTLPAHSRLYHNVAGYRLRGPFSAEAWRRAVAGLVARHEVLRTSFSLQGFSEPVQLVHGRVAAPVTVEDLTGLSPEEQEQQVQRRFQQERDLPFRIEQAPLIRFHVQALTADTMQLWVVEHHAIMDGWSGRSLFVELLAGYLAALRGDPTVAPASAARFRSLVRLEREALRNTESREFWTRLLDGATATAVPRSLSGDAPPDMVMSDHELPGQLSVEVVGLAARLGVPVRVLLLAAHLRVMALASGSVDVVTGVVYNGRVEEPDGDRVVGMFLNTLPFRCRLDEGTWADLIRQVAGADRQIQPHRRFPMPEIQRRAGASPLVETFFNYTHFHVSAAEPTEGVTVLAETGVVPTGYPLGAEFYRDLATDRIGLGLRRDAARYSVSDATRLHGYYVAALSAMVAAPDDDHRSAPLLSRAELDRLAGWNDTAVEHPGPHLLHQLVERQVRATPDHVAVVFAGERTTYRELEARANRVAHHLVSLGVRPGHFVGVSLDRSPDLVVALLAVLKAGSAYVPIDRQDPTGRIAGMVAEAGIGVVLAEPADLARLESCGAAVATVDGADPALPDSPPAVRVHPDDPAYLIFTSGSTGRPKGVVVPHRAIINRLLWMQDEFGLGPADRVLQKTPHTFDVSVWEFFWPLLTGACLVVCRPGGHRDPGHLAEEIRRHGVTTVHFVPSMLRAFLDQDHGDACASLVRVMCSGEALPPDLRDLLLRRLNVELVNLYGPTEAAVDVTSSRCRPQDGDVVPIGWPIANTRMYVLDEAGRLLPPGVQGELCIAGTALADGYRNRPELTAERFVHRVLAGRDERLYRTGDLGRHLSGGELQYLGRIDDQVKIRGIRVEPGEIETVLATHPAVRECAVSLVGDQLVAYVVGAGGFEPDVRELRDHLADRLPEHMVPARWVRRAELPLSRNGKLDRRRLTEAATGMAALAEPAGGVGVAGAAGSGAPSTDLQRRLAAIWQRLLGVGAVGVHDRFRELGGHSLLAMRLAVEIHRELGRQVSVTDLLTNDTVAALADALERRPAPGADGPTLVELRAAGSRPPLVLVHPAGGDVGSYRDLADLVAPGRPVLAVAAGVEDTGQVASVGRLADSYLGLLRDRGLPMPLQLAGWSFGGAIALEMAHRLSEDGASTVPVCMIDSSFPGHTGAVLQDEQAALPPFVDLLRGAGLRLEPEEAARLVDPDSGLTVSEKLRWLAGRALGRDGGDDVELQRRWRSYFGLVRAHLRAHDAYVPPRYRGVVTFVAGRDTTALGSAQQWRTAVGGEFRSRTVDAGHYTILRPPYVGEVAALLDESLDAAGAAR